MTPLRRPSSRAHMPAQFTRISVAIGPWDVSTPATAPRSSRTPVTVTPSWIAAPPARAPRASAWVMSAGLALPSPGIHTGADQVVGAHERVALARELGADHLGVDTVGARERGVALELGHALARARHGEAAAALPAGRLARLGFEALVEIGAVPDEPGQVARGAQLTHETRRMPRRAAGETALLEQHHVLPPELGQVVGDARADDAAADNDHARAWLAITGRGSAPGRRCRSFSAGAPPAEPRAAG